MRTALARLIGRSRIAFETSDVVGGVRHAVGADAMTTCGVAVRARDEVAVGVGRQQRHVADVGVGQVDAEDVAGLRLDVAPRWPCRRLSPCRAAVAPVAIGDQLAVAPCRASVLRAGTPGARGARCRSGSGRRTAWSCSVLVDVVGGAEDAVGPGRLVARVSTMKLVVAARARRADRPAASGMKTVPLPPLVTRSRPWSKNWPKNVNQRVERRRQAGVRRDVGQADVRAIELDAELGQG